MLDDDLLRRAARVADLLLARGETVGVAEGSCGGLVSASLLSVGGASRYYVGGAVIYTGPGRRAFLADAVPVPEGLRGATEQFATYAAEAVRVQLGTTWAIGEGGAAGPAGNPYGDPPGHCWVAVAGPSARTRHLLTGLDDRVSNMRSFTAAALDLLADSLVDAPTGAGA